MRVSKTRRNRDFFSEAPDQPIEIENGPKGCGVLFATDRVLGLNTHQTRENWSVILRIDAYCILPDTRSIPTRYLSQSKSPYFQWFFSRNWHRNHFSGEGHFQPRIAFGEMNAAKYPRFGFVF